MSRYALMRGDEVVNVIEADESFIETIRSEWDEVLEVVGKQDGTKPERGGRRVGGQFQRKPARVRPTAEQRLEARIGLTVAELRQLLNRPT